MPGIASGSTDSARASPTKLALNRRCRSYNLRILETKGPDFFRSLNFAGMLELSRTLAHLHLNSVHSLHYFQTECSVADFSNQFTGKSK